MTGAVLCAVVVASASTDRPRAERLGLRGVGTADARAAGVTCTRYAAPWGRDGNRGTRPRPFRTAQRLANSLRPGQTGCLRRGTYDSARDHVLDLRRPNVRIRSHPRERARLVGIVNVASSASGVTLSYLDIEGEGTANTVKVYAADARIEHNRITNRGRGRSCMILGSNSGAGQAARPIVRRNRFHDCGSTANGNQDHAIYAQNVVDGQITENLFWNSSGFTIQLYPNAQRTRVAHNVIDGGPPSVRGGVIFGGDSRYASNHNVVEHNVITYAVADNVTSYWDGAVGTGNIARKNCVWAARDRNVDDAGRGFTADENLVAPPSFVSRAARDYRLRRGSRCLPVVLFDAASRLRSP